MSRKNIFLVIVFLMLTVAGIAESQESSPYDHVAASARVASLHDQKGGPFGDSINRQNGTLSFQQEDITLLGVGPDISIVRKFDVYERASVNWWHVGAFLDWDIDLPRVYALMPIRTGSSPSWGHSLGNWNITGYGGARCTKHGLLGVNNWKYDAILSVPGGEYPILIRSAVNSMPSLTMTVGGGSVNSALVTKSGWQIGCLPSVKNDAGEGFFAVSPDGTKYWFDWMDGSSYRGFLDNSFLVTMASLLVTRVEDRLGNWVSYNYQGTSLVSIAASDGRAVSLEWAQNQDKYSAPYITKITTNPGSSNQRIWEYEYSLSARITSLNGDVNPAFSGLMYRSGTLRGIKLPDSSVWSFQLDTLMHTCFHLPEDPSCAHNYNNSGFPLDTFSGSMTAPSGLKGEYTVQNKIATRTGAAQHSDWSVGLVALVDTPDIEVPQIIKKRWVGPGIDYRWAYAFEGETANGPDGNGRIFVETNPDESIIKYFINNSWRDPFEGVLLRKEIYNSATSSSLQRVEIFNFAEPVAGSYPGKIGSLVAGYMNRGAHEEFRPVRMIQNLQDGVIFKSAVEQYDIFARPTKITKSSGPAP